MEDRPSKCEDVANAVSLINLGIYYHLYRLRELKAKRYHFRKVGVALRRVPRFVTFCVILYYHGPIARVNPKEFNYDIQRIRTESIAK